MSGRKILFKLSDGSPVYEDDVLYHPDRRRVGWYCIAEFKPALDNDTVTVRAQHGAVPVVLISELRREPPIVEFCNECGQQLPEEE